MVRLTRIYTKTGDDGTTALGNGVRVAKNCSRIEAIGAIDEANAALGMARTHLQGDVDLLEIINRIQNDLFDCGADLCNPGESGGLRMVPAQIARLEQEIDRLNKDLSPLSSFILPGGNPAASILHLSRTILRRAERRIVTLAEEESINKTLLHYVNRLSDHLFVLSRWVNEKGRTDILWVPGQNR